MWQANLLEWMGRRGSHTYAAVESATGQPSTSCCAQGSPSGLATGTSSYSERPDGPIVRTYDNCFVMRFDPGGRCREFTEVLHSAALTESACRHEPGTTVS